MHEGTEWGRTEWARTESNEELHDWFVRHRGRAPDSLTELLLAADEELRRLNPRLQARHDAYVQAATALGGPALAYARRRWAMFWQEGIGTPHEQVCRDLGITSAEGTALAGEVFVAAHEILVRSEGYRLQGRGAPLRQIDLLTDQPIDLPIDQPIDPEA